MKAFFRHSLFLSLVSFTFVAIVAAQPLSNSKAFIDIQQDIFALQAKQVFQISDYT